MIFCGNNGTAATIPHQILDDCPASNRALLRIAYLRDGIMSVFVRVDQNIPIFNIHIAPACIAKVCCRCTIKAKPRAPSSVFADSGIGNTCGIYCNPIAERYSRRLAFFLFGLNIYRLFLGRRFLVLLERLQDTSRHLEPSFKAFLFILSILTGSLTIFGAS